MEAKLASKIGTAARAARTALGLSQADAAEQIDISVEFYSRIERGKTMPSVPTLAKMVDGLGVGADALLGRKAPFPGAAAGARSRHAGLPQSPEIRRLLRRLRRATPATVRLLNRIVAAIENAARAAPAGPTNRRPRSR